MDSGKWAVAGAGLGVGLFLGLVFATKAEEPNPALRTLDANLYVQTSPEYRALCLQCYRLAREKLTERLRAAAKDRPPAVVMDLDETVFDNSPFQTWLYKNAATFSQERWTPWEEGKLGLPLAVPGAVEFINAAEAAGAEVFYISNRTDASRGTAAAVFAQLGINAANLDRRLLLKTTKSDKSERRALVAKTHQVVMLVGDTLTDFSEDFASGKIPEDAEGRRKLIAARKAKVDAARDKWGAEWIVLPNPSYGDFTRVGGTDPATVMNPTMIGD